MKIMCRQSARRKEKKRVKQIAFVLSGVAIIVVIILGILTMSHRTLRESEMENSLADVVKSALDEVVQTQDLDITNEDALMASFYESLLQRINAGKEGNEDPNFDLQVDIAGIDTEKGILAIHVEEKYTKPNGKIGEVKCDATATFDEKKTSKRHDVTFYVDDALWLTYEITEKETFVEPEAPTKEGQTFIGWTKDPASPEPVNLPAYVTEDEVYYAVFR